MINAVECLISFGANEGDLLATLETVVDLMPRFGFEFRSVSRPIVTEPIGGPAGQAVYVNAAIRAQSQLSADDGIAGLLALEAAIGRVRQERWGPRIVDLDLLLHGSSTVRSGTICVPHPRMTFRRFVLEPAVEIAAEMVHPIANVTLAQLLNALNDRGPAIGVWIANEKQAIELSRSFEQLKREKPLQVRGAQDDFPAAKVEAFSILPVASLDDASAIAQNVRLMMYSSAWDEQIFNVACGPLWRFESIEEIMREFSTIFAAMGHQVSSKE